ERTRSILAAANDAFVGMDASGVITDWNGAAEAIFGWSAEEAVGRRLGETIVPPGYRQGHVDGLARYMATGQGPILGRRVEVTALRRDGREFPAELSIWCTSPGGVPSFSAFVHDITDRKRTERALADARDQAMDASRLKSQFLATMSHEIRTPMNGVIGLTELLLTTDLDEEQARYGQSLHRAGAALLEVIDDILDLSKIEAGRLEPEDIAFDPHRLVADVVDLMAEGAKAKCLTLVGTCTPEIDGQLQGDPGRLRQILVNLVSNAVKFTDHGDVVLRVGRAGEPTADWVIVRFEVTDTGIGIAKSDQARILEPFSQADSSTTRRFGGTGLGLAICSQLTKAMGGCLSLASRPGQGSTFWVDLPLGRRWDAAGST
ncbi:MAG: ATP-binding protein, partial [Candidatus Dormibacteria bacterium]